MNLRNARTQHRRPSGNHARVLLGVGALSLLGACGGSVIAYDDPVEDSGVGGSVSNGGSGGSAQGGHAGTGGLGSTGGMGQPTDASVEAAPPPDANSVCSPPTTDECAMCAYSNCCDQLVACVDDTLDEPGETKTCQEIWACGLECNTGSFADCLAQCDEGNFNVQVNDLYQCIYHDWCAVQCQ